MVVLKNSGTFWNCTSAQAVLTQRQHPSLQEARPPSAVSQDTDSSVQNLFRGKGTTRVTLQSRADPPENTLAVVPPRASAQQKA